MTAPKFTIPLYNMPSFIVSALADINAKTLVLNEILKQIYSNVFEKTEKETREYFDELLRQANIEVQAQYFSKYGGTAQK